MGQKLNRLLAKPMLGLIWMYQKILKPTLFPRPVCRFTPTCSEYGRQAFATYGFFKGFYLTTKRILKCNPFHKGGYDPLP